MASINIAVFAKTPNLTPAKTRLAADIGNEQASIFYEHSLRCTSAILAQLQSQHQAVNITWAVAEKDHKENTFWQDKNSIWTGDGDLGQRLHQVYSHLKKQSDIVILIGSDCPHLCIEPIIDAINILQKSPNNVVIGPAEDGGFYLFASNTSLKPSVWTNTRYSEKTTLEQLLQQLQQPVQLLDFTFDIDTITELRQLQKLLSLSDKSLLLMEQQQLLSWLQQLHL